MIIDSHTHFGITNNFYLPEKMLLNAMKKGCISKAVISNIEGAEFDGCKVALSSNKPENQILINTKTLEIAREYPGKFYPLVWIMPHTGGVTEDFIKFIDMNQKSIFGFKIHPFLNNVNFDSCLLEPYLRLAASYNLPIVVHTASTDESSPERVEKVAKNYRQLKFLMAHMGLYTDYKDAIKIIMKNENVYGDTSWVAASKTLEIIETGGIDKILFGTDSPLNGESSYTKSPHKEYFILLKDKLSKSNYNKLMHTNSIKFFDIHD